MRLKYKHSLRFRITLSFLLFGGLLTLLIAAGVNFLIEDIESRMLAESLETELSHYIAAYKRNPELRPPNTASIKGFIAPDGKRTHLPEYLRDLPPGEHEVRYQGKVYQVLSQNINSDQVFILHDVTLFEEREDTVNFALVLTVATATLLAWLSGFLLSREVIAPVAKLADEVGALETDKVHEKLAHDYAQDEVGALAQTFDRYLERLHDFIDREREFSANASHELRTPLAVINGAAELLLTDSALSERMRHRLLRIERAGKDMSQVLDTLLFLAREQNSHDQRDMRCQATRVAQQALENYRYLIAEKPVKLGLELRQDFTIAASETVVAIVIGNLLRNAFAHTPEGEVNIVVTNNTIQVTDTGTGIDSSELPLVFERHYRGKGERVAGSGLGLAIVKRICDRFGWKIMIDSEKDKGTCVTVSFPATTA
jgi:signal transduction histidine kinase